MISPDVGLARPTLGMILVVDDEPAVRALFARTLRDAGYATLEAADGVEALEQLDQHEVTLVLLDSTMPRLDGTGVIRAIRARPALRTLPIILVTAKANLEDRVLGLAAGADDYLAKPVSLDELEARVNAQLRSHTAWADAVEREAAQRRAMTAALRGIRSDGSPEEIAGSLVDRLVPALGLEAAGLASILPDGSIVPLAATGDWADRVRPGVPIDPPLARRLLEHIAHGPWVIDLYAEGADALAGDGVVIALPLDGPAGQFGLLTIRVRLGEDGTREIVQRMPLFVELADLTGAALREVVEAGGGLLRQRTALETVIGRRAFTPYFQPVVWLNDGRTTGYETLTRFDDGTPPDRRFAEAARLGLGLELERATLVAAMEAAHTLPRDAILGVNVSPEFVLAGDLTAVLVGADRRLVVELTEHAPIEDYGAVHAALAAIRPEIYVTVDDAGSGYASLRHILALRPTYVKLDLSWVRDVDSDPARQALVAGLVHFAREVGCWLIGEGIETEAERDTLLRLGVQLGQGYLFGRPAPAPTAALGGRTS